MNINITTKLFNILSKLMCISIKIIPNKYITKPIIKVLLILNVKDKPLWLKRQWATDDETFHKNTNF